MTSASFKRLLLLVATAGVAATAAGAQDETSGSPSWSLSGDAGPVVELYFDRNAGGGLAVPRVIELGGSASVDLKASAPNLLFRTGLDAVASAASPSTLDQTDSVSASLLEMELSWLPAPAFAFRAGKLLRSLGLGQAGSPADPFAVEAGQGGFWGFEAEWTGGTALSALGILSIDRAATQGELPDPSRMDGGFVVKDDGGLLDGALGAYIEGDVERRAVADLSIPVGGFLASAEGGLAFPSKGGDPEGAIRACLQRSVDMGGLSAELGLAWRQSWPGRNASQVALLADEVAVAAASGREPPFAPFGPYWGTSYGELTLAIDSEGVLSLSAGIDAEPTLASVAWLLSAEAWAGNLRAYVDATGSAGSDSSEFVTVAEAAGQPALDLEVGVGISF